MIRALSERAPLPGFLVGILFVAVSVVYVCLLQVGVELVAAGIAVAMGEDPMDLASGLLIDPFVLGLGSLLQTGGLFVIAVGIAWLTRRPLLEAFAVRPARVGAFVGALAIGLAAGLFAGWVAEVVATLFEGFPMMDPAHFEMITDAILSEHRLKQAFFIGVVVIGAPLFEELIFRGLLWDSFESSAGPWVAWIVTSVLFASYHVVPIHVISVFSTGALIGLLRLFSGSIWPSMFAHFLNNALSVVLVLLLGDAADDFESTVLWAAVGLFASAAGVGVAYALGRPRLVGSPPADHEGIDGIE